MGSPEGGEEETTLPLVDLKFWVTGKGLVLSPHIGKPDEEKKTG